MLGLQPYPSVDEYDIINYLKAKNVLDKPILSSVKMCAMHIAIAVANIIRNYILLRTCV